MTCYEVGIKTMLKYTSYKDTQSFGLKLLLKSCLLYCSLSGSVLENILWLQTPASLWLLLLLSWKDNPAMPVRLIYEGVFTKPPKYSGGSAAQSIVLHAFNDSCAFVIARKVVSQTVSFSFLFFFFKQEKRTGVFLLINKTKHKLKCHEVYIFPDRLGNCVPAICYCVKSINIRSQQDISLHFQILKHRCISSCLLQFCLKPFRKDSSFL